MVKLAKLSSVLLLAACSAGNVDDTADGVNSEQSLATGVYNLGTLASPGKCLDVAGNGSANGTNIHSWTCNGSIAQSFRVEPFANAYRVVNTGSNKCVDVSASGTANGTNVQLWDCNGTNAQNFRIEQSGENIRLINVNSNKCLDVARAGTADGTNVQIWDCNGTNAQWWRPANIGSGPSGGGSTGGGSTGGGTGPGGSGWTSVAPRGDGFWVRVKNGCSFPIWIYGAGATATLGDVKLNPGTTHDYVAPKEWPAARVTAYGSGPRQGELEKAEMTFTGGVLNYNVTYVDWVGLPLEIYGVGGNCNSQAHTTGCYAKQSQINAGCPEGFLRDGQKCLAARTFCMNPNNWGHEYCKRLGPQTPDIYACSGPYAQDPRGCAARNRGMVGREDNPDASLYYQNPPYNTYAKWVHQVCPDIYAFSYDDWLSHGGFRACSGNELRITFCPSG
jgi:hypothetical protein